MRRTTRTAIYSGVGFVTEIGFSALHDLVRKRAPRFRTSPWMFPIYALIQPLYEPLHDALRDRPAYQRAITYSAGFLAIEYSTGWLLRQLRGEAPWDYSESRLNVDGLIRLDYSIFWAAAGLALEPLHDSLVARSSTP